MADEFGGAPIEEEGQTDQFGGVPVEAAGKTDQFGGVPVEEKEPEPWYKTAGREALRALATAPPTLAGAGLGAAALSELGPIGTVVGGLGGGIAGSIGGNKFVDWALEKAGLRQDPNSFFSEQQEQAGREANPKSALVGSLAVAPAIGSAAGATVAQRLLGGAAGAGLSAGQDIVEGRDVDLGSALANAVAFGTFANMRPMAGRFVAAGERVGKPVGDLFRKGGTTEEVPPGATQPETHAPGQEAAEVPTSTFNTDTAVPPRTTRGASESPPPPDAGGQTEPKANPTVGNPDSAGVAGKEASPSSTDLKGREYTPDRILADRQSTTKTITTGDIPDDVMLAIRPKEETPPPPAPERPPNAPVFSEEERARAQAGAAPKPEETKPVTKLEPGGTNPELAKRAPLTAPEDVTGSIKEPVKATPEELERLADELLKRHEGSGGLVPGDREVAKQRLKEVISKAPEGDQARVSELMAERERLQKELSTPAEPVTAAVKEPLQFVKKTLDALAKKGTPEAVKLAEGIRGLPHEQQTAAAAKAAAMLASRTGKVPTADLKNQRFRNAETVPTLEVGGKKVSFKSKSDAARATQALQAMRTAMDEHPPVEGENRVQMNARLRQAAARAKELNGGKSPADTYKPREKPAEWLWTRHAERGSKGVSLSEKKAASLAADEKLLRGSPEDVEAYRANRRGEADIAKSRRSGDEAIAGAEAEQAQKGDVSLHTPEAQDKLQEDFQTVGANIRKYADAGDVYTREQRSKDERSVAKPEDVAAFKAEKTKKAATYEDVKTRISRPTLHAVNKAVKDAPAPPKEPTPAEKYPGPCT